MILKVIRYTEWLFNFEHTHNIPLSIMQFFNKTFNSLYFLSISYGLSISFTNANETKDGLFHSFTSIVSLVYLQLHKGWLFYLNLATTIINSFIKLFFVFFSFLIFGLLTFSHSKIKFTIIYNYCKIYMIPTWILCNQFVSPAGISGFLRCDTHHQYPRKWVLKDDHPNGNHYIT